MRLATGGIIKDWKPLWEDDPQGVSIPLSFLSDNAAEMVEDFAQRLDDEVVVNITIEVKPCA